MQFDKINTICISLTVLKHDQTLLVQIIMLEGQPQLEQLAGLVVNYGISNTVVLEIP